MARMVRKQIYIQKQQQEILKRLARARGLSEAELIRQAIDHQVGSGVQSILPDPAAWDEAHQFMLALRARGPLQDQPRNWTREDLYEERLSRHDHNSH
jgi:sensor domain CHASE-containing protein